MIQSQVLSGRWEDIVSRNSAQLLGRRVTVTIEPEMAAASPTVFPPNEQALATLRELAKLQKGMKSTDGAQSNQLFREARAGGMYGIEPTE